MGFSASNVPVVGNGTADMGDALPIDVAVDAAGLPSQRTDNRLVLDAADVPVCGEPICRGIDALPANVAFDLPVVPGECSMGLSSGGLSIDLAELVY